MDKCKTPLENGVCTSPCKTGNEPPVWDQARFPQECCRSSSRRVVDVDTLNRYSLGGNGHWWQCRVCKRTHPFDPTGVIQ